MSLARKLGRAVGKAYRGAKSAAAVAKSDLCAVCLEKCKRDDARKKLRPKGSREPFARIRARGDNLNATQGVGTIKGATLEHLSNVFGRPSNFGENWPGEWHFVTTRGPAFIYAIYLNKHERSRSKDVELDWSVGGPGPAEPGSGAARIAFMKWVHKKLRTDYLKRKRTGGRLSPRERAPTATPFGNAYAGRVIVSYRQLVKALGLPTHIVADLDQEEPEGDKNAFSWQFAKEKGGFRKLGDGYSDYSIGDSKATRVYSEELPSPREVMGLNSFEWNYYAPVLSGNRPTPESREFLRWLKKKLPGAKFKR